MDSRPRLRLLNPVGVKCRLIELGLSQVQLAENMKASRWLVTQACNGTRGVDDDFVAALAAQLQIDASKLVA